MMVDAAVVDGADLSTTLDGLVEDGAIDHIHVHFAARGCWATRMTRSEGHPHR